MSKTPPSTTDLRSTRSNKIKGIYSSSSSTPKDSPASGKQIEQLIKSNNLLLEQNKQIIQKMGDLENAIQFFSNKYDELKIMYDKVTIDNEHLKKTNEHIHIKNTELQQQHIEINNELNYIKQNEIKKNIVIFGVPNVKDHNSLVLTFENLLKQIEINENDIEVEDIFQKKNIV